MTETSQALTSADFDSMMRDDRWLGFGYLGGRHHCEDAEAVAAADALALQIANERGWTVEQLFQWANSKNGRWFADCALCADFATALRYI